DKPWMGRPCSISLTIPPLAAIVLKPVQPTKIVADEPVAPRKPATKAE
ncbi:MAG: hypothetical protein RLZZ09_2737, partial [Pseudomonadota bacterium]